MKIVVTGAAGFIGSHLCEALLGRGHEVVGVDGFDSYLYPAEVKRGNAADLAARAAGRPFSLVEGDICDRALMARVCGAPGVDVVCHLAALAGVRPSIREPLRYLRSNVEGSGVVLEACRAAGVTRLVVASSSSVYGSRLAPGQDPASVGPFREDDPCLQPASPYAATKRAVELICSSYRDLFGMGISSLRFFTVYGPRQRPEMAIHHFTRAIAAGEPIAMYGDGSSRRDYTFIDDIIAGTVAACERVAPGALRIYNLGGTRTTSLAELIALIGRVVGREPVVEVRPDQPGDVPVTYADVSLAARELGYQPTTRIEDGVARFWEWFKARAA